MRKLILLLTLATLILSMAACDAGSPNSGAAVLAANTVGEIQAEVAAEKDAPAAPDPITAEYNQDDLDAGPSSETQVEVAAEEDTPVVPDPIIVEYDQDDLDADISSTGGSDPRCSIASMNGSGLSTIPAPPP